MLINKYKPEKRQGWNQTEFVIDVDAKEPPQNSKCQEGEVCIHCLSRSRR